jgi:hypothetical protein
MKGELLEPDWATALPTKLNARVARAGRRRRWVAVMMVETMVGAEGYVKLGVSAEGR